MESNQQLLIDSLEVGALVLISAADEHQHGRMRSAIRGWRTGQMLFLDRPRRTGGLLVNIGIKQAIVVRFVSEGRAIAFDSTVIEIGHNERNPLVIVQWPREVSVAAFRKHDRLPLHCEAELRMEGGDTCLCRMRDISLGGSGMSCDTEVPLGTPIRLSFELPDGTRVEGLQATVRSMQPKGPRFLLGCQFEQDDKHLNDVAFYISSAQTLLRKEHGDKPADAMRALIVDNDHETAARLRQNFERRKFEVFVAQNAIEAIHRMRMVSPNVMLIKEGGGAASGCDLCRLVRAHAEYRAMPIFIYGGDPENDGPRAEDAGAAGYFAPSPALAPTIVHGVVRHLGSIGKR